MTEQEQEQEQEQEEDENKRIRPRERALGQKRSPWVINGWKKYWTHSSKNYRFELIDWKLREKIK